jgi:Tfp pilus assembly protein PilO
MRARLESLSPRNLTIVAVVAVLLYAAVVWLLIVSPKRSDAAAARADVAAAETRLADAQVAATRSRKTGAPTADVFRLAKAMPASADQPGLVLELSRLAKQSGVTLRSITPADAVAGVGGPTLIPLTVTVGGSYRKIANFLFRTRGLVTVRGGTIHARGRLLDVQSVALTESVSERFPKLDATIALNAYVYDGPIAPVEVPEVTEEGEESSSPDGASAAGSVD